MSTIVTRPSPRDAKQGRMIHWNEDRCLSIVEAKRAQGFLDEEILLGPTATQWKIIGNSVAREVSLALGVVIADAVMRSYGGNFRALEEAEEEAMVERSPYWEAAPSRGSGGVGYPRDERADEPGSDGATATRK
ncbi:DNA methyltransferase Dim-2 [Cordyceps fumosorosea ARSEF 2679]|uniref:DNA methyltransferase Dim-2 n=1 Tax=Cordyceps fumosorosea (strain ARSEF 2679) TaxID=1081104 RepID=A0A167MDK8_CORFA|nr:DNA methyltransferase Dim-2 [Cordyceps fumosorosea ARSEF 2679]OAA54236.1 DNA methyltransferase Dim-2 [Cordyceps fumosorosea ARSEF 2679]